jgi:type III secretion protein V
MLSWVNRSSDLVLSFMIVCIIMMLIIPVSPGVIDVLISINLTISISILFTSLYIQRATNLSIFPSLLLITTMYRLGVNIASTRQILLHANAGKIIYSFGHFVVGGNFIVGGIVFLIITIVQFIVVTKGAERVAEVAARFTLDAMPGKQMSIDADLRSGVIDTDQARQLRLGLSKESQLYGAMDGAMKFVKGDVIAGIVIALINIVGGLIIGMTMHGMTALQAAKTYSLLSIGDGLVTQIPSIMIAITAGIVTTRVTSDKKDSNLGKEIAEQIGNQPKALMIAGIVLFLMMLLPGFPKIPFLILSSLIGFAGFYLNMKAKKLAAKEIAGAVTSTLDVEGHALVEGGSTDYALTLPVMLEVGPEIAKMIDKDKKGESFMDKMIPKMRNALYQDLGVRFPGVHVKTTSTNLAKDEYVIYLHEVPLIKAKLMLGHVLTNESEDTLRRYNIPYVSGKKMGSQPALWVKEEYTSILDKAGIQYWKTLEVLILHLSKFFRTYAHEFLGIQEMRGILEFLEKSYPDLIKEVSRLVPLQKMTDIFKRLVQEGVSIKDLRTILESLSEWAQTEKETILLTEYVRSSLKRYISYKYSQGQSVLAVYLIDPEIEEMVRASIKQTSAGSYIALDPDSVQMIMQAVRKTITIPPAGGQMPVLLTAIDVRRYIRKLVEGEYPDMAVLSFQEIVPEIRIQPLGRIQIK